MEISKVSGQTLRDVEDILRGLVDSSQEQLKIATGLSTGIYNRASLQNAIEECLERLPIRLSDGSKPCKVLLDSDVSEGREDDYLWWFDDPKVDARRSLEKVSHMVIVDSNNFRIEDPHSEAAPLRSNTMILDATASLAHEANAYFDSFFDRATPLLRRATD